MLYKQNDVKKNRIIHGFYVVITSRHFLWAKMSPLTKYLREILWTTIDDIYFHDIDAWNYCSKTREERRRLKHSTYDNTVSMTILRF